MAVLSMKSLRKFNPNVAITLVTNKSLDIESIEFWIHDFDKLIILNYQDDENRAIKSNIYKYASHDKELYIDCDTYITSDLSNVFRYLNYYDIAIRLNQNFQTSSNKGGYVILDSLKVSDLPHWNGGFFAFKKNNNVEIFFHNWEQNYKKTKLKFDQISLNETIYSTRSNVDLLSLNEEWNYFPGNKYYSLNKHSSKIVHYTNRLSPVIQKQLISISRLLDLNLFKIKKDIKYKLKSRKKKIGFLRYIFMLIQWKLLNRIERNLLKNL